MPETNVRTAHPTKIFYFLLNVNSEGATWGGFISVLQAYKQKIMEKITG